MERTCQDRSVESGLFFVFDYAVYGAAVRNTYDYCVIDYGCRVELFFPVHDDFFFDNVAERVDDEDRASVRLGIYFFLPGTQLDASPIPGAELFTENLLYDRA